MAGRKYNRTFIGSAKEVFDGLIKVSMKKEDMDKIPITQSKSGAEWVNFDVGTRREIDQFGNTHSVFFSVEEGKEDEAKKKEDDDFDF